MAENQTKIFIHGLKIDALLGIYPEEIGRKQPVVVNVEALLENFEIASDNIEDTISYTPIRDEIIRLSDIQFSLAETFAERIAEFCFKDPRLLEVKIRIGKITIFSDCIVGSEITRVR